MGLDQWLFKKNYDAKSCRENGVELQPWYDVVYWRKANAIHRWFGEHLTDDKHIANCTDYPVTIEQLTQLRNDCEQVFIELGLNISSEGLSEEDVKYAILEVKAHENTKKKIEALFCPMEGFFFGTQEYDRWFFEDMFRTWNDLNNVIENHHDGDEYKYHAWW